MNKEERKEAKVSELMQIYEELPEEKLKVASDLISQAAFMAIELEDLAEIISKEGMTEEYTNGANQSGRKISSNAKMYSSLIGKYASITTKLLQLVPVKSKPLSKPKLIETIAKEQTDYSSEEWKREQEYQSAVSGALIRDPSIDLTEFRKEWERQNMR